MVEPDRPNSGSASSVPYYEDEIDLYELWLILKKRKFVVFCVTLLFVFIAGLYVWFAPNVYRADTIVSSPYSVRNGVIFSLDSTNNLVGYLSKQFEHKAYEKLSRELDLPVKLLVSVKGLETVKKRKGSDRYFVLRFDAIDKSVLASLSDAVIKYLNNNEYLKQIIDQEKALLEEEIRDLSLRVKNLEASVDFIKKEIMSGKEVGFNPLEIDRTVIDLKRRLKTLQYQLETGISGYRKIAFMVYDKPVKPKRTLIITVALVSGLFLGIFLAFFLEWLENARREHEKVSSEV
ncbi:lipopolysaccharide biosynthesis protein [Thermosulfidibacter takaii ABI70S6]|uniref:Lipopolysaccharide biosynthesis protein n=1 Tax=Thermosulfidibacter takaii (strain DSM 17441 / JCM 13301 / NBRC 103674 / ABI70S6) TaxID=1298851 RepID=A0A0S3QUS7_THET7|nr:Wzz/FepE/Etk N-terminal domain-containing protein [Thermosulfidibacter takaii]BAT72085.1 lipopolysaccharide biosynthesis protein [Thermosulfidibacter takaii ABI70S6]